MSMRFSQIGFAALLISSLQCFGDDAPSRELIEWRAPKIRFDDIPASKALYQVALAAPKDKDGNSIFIFKIIPHNPARGLKDTPIHHYSNQELFWDLVAGITQSAGWDMNFKSGVYIFTDKPLWSSTK